VVTRASAVRTGCFRDAVEVCRSRGRDLVDLVTREWQSVMCGGAEVSFGSPTLLATQWLRKASGSSASFIRAALASVSHAHQTHFIRHRRLCDENGPPGRSFDGQSAAGDEPRSSCLE